MIDEEMANELHRQQVNAAYEVTKACIEQDEDRLKDLVVDFAVTAVQQWHVRRKLQSVASRRKKMEAN